MRNKIEEIRQGLSGDHQKRQDYIVFSEKEKQAVLEAEKILGLPKSMAIAVACRFIVENLKKEDSQEAKTDGK
ncbi:MAG: hypothetical protein ACYDH1_19295 [Anaerolineaceae bacterium]